MSASETNERLYTRHEPLCDDDIDIVEDITSRLDHTIYRFKFTEDFMAELYKFAKIHQYDHRKDFKEAWTKWTDENSDIITTLTTRCSRVRATISERRAL